MTTVAGSNSSTPLFHPFLYGISSTYKSRKNILQGLSIGINNRDIRVAKNNMKVSDLQVKLQVATTVSAVLNLYWDLV